MRLVLVRHAEPVDSVRGRCYGSLDVGLSPAGERQAERLAAALATPRLAAVYSSPRRRALDTARPVAAAHGLVPRVLDGLRELDFGELEGRTYEEIERERPELYRRWMETPIEVRFPGGESYADLRARVGAVLGELLGRHRGETVAAVTHGGPARAALAGVLQMPDAAIFRLAQDYGCASVVEWLDDVPVVARVNERLFL